MRHRVRVLPLIPVVLLASCAPAGRIQLPSARASVDGTARDSNLFEETLRPCSLIPVTARVQVEGTIQGTRVRRSVWVGTDADNMRIEASAQDGAPFVLWGNRVSGGRTGLWLPGERKVVMQHDLPELAAAAIGIPLSGLELYGLLTTCPMFQNGGVEINRLAPDVRQIRISQDTVNTYVNLARRNATARWRLQSVTVARRDQPRWRVEFSSPVGSVPSRVRISRLEWTGEPSPALDLRLTIDRAHLDIGIGPAVLTPAVPASDERVSLADITSSRGGRPLLAQ